MDILTRKSVMIYKNEIGGRIAVKIELPFTKDSECDIDRVYSSLTRRYLDSARDFIASKNSSSAYSLNVTFEVEEGKKYTKIRRKNELRCEKSILRGSIFCDLFENGTFKLKS